MNKITQLSITVYLYARAIHARATERLTDEDRERGSTSTEMVLIIAGLALLALTVIAVITKKVIDKANSINF